MDFTTFEFLIFFAFVLILNWELKKWPLVWRFFLFLASYVFYALFDIRFVFIIFVVSLINFLSAWLIDKSSLSKKKAILIGAIVFNVLVLALFKYYDFFRVSAETFLGKIGLLASFPVLEIILPVGLSFYIFRAISYNADVYLKKISPSKSFLDFAVYIAFFPQLFAGPITRPNDFLPQLANGGAKKIEDLWGSFSLIISGLFKKLVLSSFLVANITDDVFAVPENHSRQILLLAVLAYTLVIYLDFSGYSDLSIGFAGLMGFRSPVNFDRPYLSLNIKEFWRRWHITLSSWFRDYVYIPLGGNRKGQIRKYINIIIVMVLAGLWHGASGHFLVWGLLFGLALVFVHFYQDCKLNFFGRILTKFGLGFVNKFFAWLATFVFVSFAWIFFRADTLERAFKFIGSIFSSANLIETVALPVLIVIAAGFVFIFLEREIIKGLKTIQEKLPFPFACLFIILIFLLIFDLSPNTIPPFIYFSF